MKSLFSHAEREHKLDRIGDPFPVLLMIKLWVIKQLNKLSDD